MLKFIGKAFLFLCTYFTATFAVVATAILKGPGAITYFVVVIGALSVITHLWYILPMGHASASRREALKAIDRAMEEQQQD